MVRILDLKAPGSGEEHRNLDANLRSLRPSDELKVVVADRVDYEWARARLPEVDPERRCAAWLLSPVWGRLDPTELARWMLADEFDAVLQLQLHKLLWPGVERGV